MKMNKKNLKNNVKAILLIVFLTISLSIKAQEKPNREKMEAMKVAYITEKVALSEKEAQQFWPIYKKYQAEKMDLQKKIRKERPNTKEMSDEELEKMIQQKFSIEKRKLVLNESYFEQFKKVLSLQKIVALYNAERDFKREILKKMKESK